MNLFEVLPEKFFTPLTSKNKVTYFDCIILIYDSYKTEFSFGVEKEVLISKLEYYFDVNAIESFDFEENIVNDSRDRALTILRLLRDYGWLEFEIGIDYLERVTLFEYSISMIESFLSVIKNEEMEYQSVIFEIHGALINKGGYDKPYEYIIKRVVDNTAQLILGLKKLNTSIKKRIDTVTKDMDVSEIVNDFFEFKEGKISDALYRLRTSENISRFRNSILENLNMILDDQNIFENVVDGFMVIEKETDRENARQEVTIRIQNVITSFRNYDQITQEIYQKETRYLKGAVSRAKFLLNNSTNIDSKISNILSYLNNIDEDSYNEDYDAFFNSLFDIYPQNSLDDTSLYTTPIYRDLEVSEIAGVVEITNEERELLKKELYIKNRNKFSRKNINNYLEKKLIDGQILASNLELKTKREMIRLIFISLYSNHPKSDYQIIKKDIIEVNGFKFNDFIIRRKK